MIHHLLLQNADPASKMELEFVLRFSREQSRGSSRQTARPKKGFLPWAR